MRNGLLQREIHALYVDVECLIEQLFASTVDGREFGDSGVSEDGIDLAEFRGDLRVETVDVGEFRDVRFYGQGIRSNDFDGFVERLLVAAGDGDITPSAENNFAVADPEPPFPPVVDNGLASISFLKGFPKFSPFLR